jgi:hypothetical protein
MFLPVKGANNELIDVEKILGRCPCVFKLSNFFEGIIAYAHPLAEQAGLMPRRQPDEFSSDFLDIFEYFDKPP